MVSPLTLGLGNSARLDDQWALPVCSLPPLNFRCFFLCSVFVKWVLGSKCRFHACVISCLLDWAISPAPSLSSFRSPSQRSACWHQRVLCDQPVLQFLSICAVPDRPLLDIGFVEKRPGTYFVLSSGILFRELFFHSCMRELSIEQAKVKREVQ